MHEVPAVSDQSLGTGAGFYFLGSLASLGTTLMDDFLISPHGDETAGFLSPAHPNVEIEEILPTTVQTGFQGLRILQGDPGGQREPDESEGLLPLDFSEFGKTEVSHIAKDKGV